MKIEIPPFRAMAKCNEYMNHNGFSIDLGEDVIQVIRCKDCEHWGDSVTDKESEICYVFGGYVKRNDYCSRSKRRVKNE